MTRTHWILVIALLLAATATIGGSRITAADPDISFTQITINPRPPK